MGKTQKKYVLSCDATWQVATAANPLHPPRTTSEMEFVKHAAGFELPFGTTHTVKHN